jgi:hypothetical protein
MNDRSPAKARLLATVSEVARSIDRLPEAACVLLEQSNLLGNLRAHVGTFGNAASAVETLVPFAQDVARGLRGLRKTANALRRR